MDINYKNIFIASYLSIFLASCSTFDGMRFWQKDDIDPEEPRELSSFNEQKYLQVQWNLSFDGLNEIGSFEPGFSSEDLFFADAEFVVSFSSKHLQNSRNSEKDWRKI